MRNAWLILLLGLTTCLRPVSSPKPTTFGFYATQCIPKRSVVCVVDDELDDPICSDAVKQSILAINAAVGRTLLIYSGTILPTQLTHEFDAGTIVIFGVAQGQLSGPQVLGITLPEITRQLGAACLTKTAILLGPDAAGANHVCIINPVYVIIHELLHAIGASHSLPGYYRSRMEPAYTDTMTNLLSPEDIQTLRAVYGN